MWIIISIILAINSMWLLKLNKDLIERNKYLIRREETNKTINGLVFEPMTQEDIEKLKETLQDKLKKESDNKEDSHEIR
ncbi:MULTISPECIES: hypothetical protein [unclassified Mammaliicoccus]|uniref:hypothetical protein n=1 Tax=unclassified Mammaliicoccus TaxID=2803851 RepID=UPI001EFBB24C|nr:MULTISPECIES: hypothetical protein [unclassified Mammaliicoccus]